VLKPTTIVLILLAALGVTPFALDIYRDRQHRIVIHGTLKIYRNSEPYWRNANNSIIATVTAREALKVMRINHGKDYMVIRVRLEDNQRGWPMDGSYALRALMSRLRATAKKEY